MGIKNAVTPELKNKGWWGPRVMTDTKTGEVINAQLGSERRLQIIFNTNIRTAFAAGQWAEIESLADAGEQVFLEYQAVDDDRTRPTHKAKDNLILPMDDPFWDYWYPPNGWRCRCWVNVLTKNAMDALNLKPSSSPELKGRMVTNTRRDNETEWVPYGVDPSFNFNVGKQWLKPYTPQMDDYKVIGDAPAILETFYPTKILPDNQDPEYYALKFLNAFGVKELDGHTLFTDKADQPLIVSKSLLTDAKGKLKTDKFARGQYILLLADAIKDPDFIERYTNEYENPVTNKVMESVKIRYIKELLMNTKYAGFSVFEYDRKTNQWNGRTVFNTTQRYINKERDKYEYKILYPKQK